MKYVEPPGPLLIEETVDELTSTDSLESTPRAHSQKHPERTLVWVRKDFSSPFERAEFSTCILDYFGVNRDFCDVQYKLENNILFLQPLPPRRGSHERQNRMKNSFRFEVSNK